MYNACCLAKASYEPVPQSLRVTPTQRSGSAFQEEEEELRVSSGVGRRGRCAAVAASYLYDPYQNPYEEVVAQPADVDARYADHPPPATVREPSQPKEGGVARESYSGGRTIRHAPNYL